MSSRSWAALVLVCCCISNASAGGPPTEAVRFAAGEAAGSYHRLASELAAALEQEPRPLAVEVLTTSGSYDNAARLRDGDAELALIQSDVAYYEYLNGQPFRALAALAIEPIHLLALRELQAHDSSDLLLVRDRSLRLAIGAPKSGTASNAVAVLNELGTPARPFELRRLTSEVALRDLAARQVDVVFLTTAAPSPLLANPTSELRLGAAVGLIDLDSRTRSRLNRRFPFLHPTDWSRKS